MKKVFYLISLLLLLSCASSCVKADQLVGTKWVSTNVELTFVSTSSLEIKDNMSSTSATSANFSLNGNKITISDSKDSVTGKISGKEMKFDAVGGNVLGGLSALAGSLGSALTGGDTDLSPVRTYLSGRTFKKQ